MDEIAQLARACEALGAPADQAQVLAAQLWKRSGQIAAERGQSREEALQYLWNLLVQARQGIVGKIPPPA